LINRAFSFVRVADALHSPNTGREYLFSRAVYGSEFWKPKARIKPCGLFALQWMAGETDEGRLWFSTCDFDA